MQYTGKLGLDDQNNALVVARNWMKSKFKDYLDTSGETMSTSNNWYKKITISQLTGLVIPEVDLMDFKETEVTTGPKLISSPYQVGMKVRDRRRGIAVPQEYGKVVDINDETMTIQWYDNKNKKIKKQKFMLDDTIALSTIVAEV
jgi:hypothetical protein